MLTLPLNEGKTKYQFFHKPRACDSIPLRLPTITFNNIKIKRESSVKFLGVLIDEKIPGINISSLLRIKYPKI